MLNAVGVHRSASCQYCYCADDLLIVLTSTPCFQIPDKNLEFSRRKANDESDASRVEAQTTSSTRAIYSENDEEGEENPLLGSTQAQRS